MQHFLVPLHSTTQWNDPFLYKHWPKAQIYTCLNLNAAILLFLQQYKNLGKTHSN